MNNTGISARQEEILYKEVYLKSNSVALKYATAMKCVPEYFKVTSNIFINKFVIGLWTGKCFVYKQKRTAPNTLSIQPSVYRKWCALAVNYGRIMNCQPWPFHTPYTWLQWWRSEHADSLDKAIHANGMGNSFANYPQTWMGRPWCVGCYVQYFVAK